MAFLTRPPHVPHPLASNQTLVRVFVGNTLCSIVLSITVVLLLSAPGWCTLPSGYEATLEERIEVLLSHYQWKPAIALMEIAAKETPGDLGTAERLVTWYRLTGDTVKLNQFIASYDQRYPNSVESYYINGLGVLGPLVAQESLSEETCRVLSKGLGQWQSAQVTSPLLYYLQGRDFAYQQAWDQAELAYLKALYHNPLHQKSLVALSQLYVEQKEPKRALTYLTQAFDQTPLDVDTLFVMGAYYLAIENPKRALQFLQLSERLDPQPRPKRHYLIQTAEFELGQGPNPATLPTQGQTSPSAEDETTQPSVSPTESSEP